MFTSSGMFQAMGNTWPALLSTSSRLLTFAIPAVWLSQRDGFRLEQIWMLSAATVVFQAVISLLLMRREMRLRLAFQDTQGRMTT